MVMIMEISIIEVPRYQTNEGKPEFIENDPLTKWIYAIAGRGAYNFIETIAGRYYPYMLHLEESDSPTLTILSPRREEIELNAVRGGLKDFVEKQKLLDLLFLEGITNWNFTMQAGHWWLKYGLPLMILMLSPISGYAYASWVDILLALYLIKGREFVVEKPLENEFKKYIDLVEKGIERVFEDYEHVNIIRDKSLQRLQVEIKTTPTQKQGYVNAIHGCTYFGFPQLQKWYSINAAMEEWKIHEMGIPFKLYKKDPLHGKQQVITRRTYAKVGNDKKLLQNFFTDCE